MSALIVVITVLFFAGSGICFYKLIAWNWKKHQMINAAREVVKESAHLMPSDVARKLERSLDMRSPD